MPIRLVLAGPHRLILEALAALLREAGGFEVLACCSDGEEAMAVAQRQSPDLLLVELRMPRVDGLEVARRLAAAHLRTPVVLLADRLDEREALEALRLKVGGVILEEMPASALLRCLRAVHSGEPWLERRSAARMIEKLVRDESGLRQATRMLTTREVEVVRMVGRGLRNRGIAEELRISEHTVKAHLGNIYSKLGARGRLDLFRFAAEKGLT
jgi:DNA-binding NarL/FixJ family response regulator